MISTRPLTQQDLPGIWWSGSPSHLRSVAKELERCDRGEVAYLVVCEDGVPRAKGAVDFCHPSGLPTLGQLATDPEHQRRGFGTELVAALEQEIVSRGLTTARLGVEVDNEAAIALYMKLGYRAVGVETDSWQAEGPDGQMREYQAVCTVMERGLAHPR